MLRDYLGNITLLDLPIIGMCIFLIVFLLVLVRVCLPSRGDSYREMAHLPLDDGTATDHTTTGGVQ